MEPDAPPPVPELELPSCSLCGARASTLLFPEPTLSPAGDRGIVRCTSCGLVYRDVRPSPAVLLQRYVEQDVSEPSADWIEGRKQVFQPYLHDLEPYRQSGRLHDVGAGHGFFLSACQQRGWSCSGTEPSVQCRRFAHRAFGLELTAELPQAAADEGSFDVVTLWNVVDQLPDPLHTLAAIHRLLRPGGAVMIRCPNAAFHVRSRRLVRRLARVLPRAGSIDASVFHLQSYDRRTMARALTQAGFARPRLACAQLTWTTSHRAESGPARQAVTMLVERLARLLHGLSGGRWLLSPSLLAVAVREGQDGGTAQEPQGRQVSDR